MRGEKTYKEIVGIIRSWIEKIREGDRSILSYHEIAESVVRSFAGRLHQAKQVRVVKQMHAETARIMQNSNWPRAKTPEAKMPPAPAPRNYQQRFAQLMELWRVADEERRKRRNKNC